MTKFRVVVGGFFVPIVVDDPKIKHDSSILIEDETQNYRLVLGLNRDEKLSQPYLPYWSRMLTRDKLIYLRDELTKLIDCSQ
jgi:hypothetical protein